MKSLNFEFLRDAKDDHHHDRAHDLAALGGFAEAYAHNDPQSALVKLRLFGERMVVGIFQRLGIPAPVKPAFIDLLGNDAFKEVAPRVVIDKLHALRIHGNKAAHGEKVSQETALWLLKEAHDLARWLFVSQLDGRLADCPDYQQPPSGGSAGNTKARLKQEKKAALERLAAQEVRLNAVLAELDQTRAQAAASQHQMANLSAVAALGQQAAAALQFSEAETRQRLIDSQLVDAGWDVGVNGADTEQVTQEHEVDQQPTPSGKGYADYVLWDDGDKPLAVIEAKKTAEDAEKGRTQARLYADSLESKHGQRPVIFYTNGFDIWIWDDAAGYPPRKLFGFYSKDSLEYLVYQRHAKQPLDTLSPDAAITDRLYQIEAIKRVNEHLTNKHRKALIAQATGTGKTRVAIALTELLIRAGWVKRVLFLCDRRELRKQARNAFNDSLNEPLITVAASTAKERSKRIYLATYPAMMKVYQSFDVGFFDLVIADESHRSVYNVYGDLFRYFDALQIGLTATPVEFVSRNTYQLFGCDNQNPTAYYPIGRGVDEGYLVPFEVRTYTTDFQRRGIKYDQLSDAQRKQVEDDGTNPEQLDFEVRDLDKNVHNKDTGRHIIRNLMENGIRDASDQQIGKSIVFARNHQHALMLRKLFDEMYPQYGGRFCQVIDNYDPRAEQLIDDFKQANNELTIAVSVDMLDTGIDVPEVVNLVFAKPVYSQVKFWQMIGRGTRLCPDLFGPGQNKTRFRIFDHWGNFDYFDFDYKAAEPTSPKSLMQRVFEARIELADAALQAAEPALFDNAVERIHKDIQRLPEGSIAVREQWRSKRKLSQAELLHAWHPATVAALRAEMAPLMQWIDIRGHHEAHQLDLLIARMQIALLQGSAQFEDDKITLLDRVNSLQMHLNPVREQAAIIKQVRSSAFWEAVTVSELETVRQALRTIIHHRASGGAGVSQAQVIDIQEDATQVQAGQRSSSIRSVDMKAYEKQIEAVLIDLFDRAPVLQKIRRAEPISPRELEQLSSLMLTQNPDLSLDQLTQFYGEAAPLDAVLRGIIGMDPDAVRARFEQFVTAHPRLSAKQTRFLDLLRNHIAKNGAIALERLYEDPFTLIDADGIDGVFDQHQADALIGIIRGFSPPGQATGQAAAQPTGPEN